MHRRPQDLKALLADAGILDLRAEMWNFFSCQNSSEGTRVFCKFAKTFRNSETKLVQKEHPHSIHSREGV